MMKRSRARHWFRRSTFVATAVLPLIGCSSLPVSGPTGHDIEHAAARPSAAAAQLPFRLVEVANAALVPPPPPVPSSTLALAPPEPTDLIGPGDVLDITVYEAGVSLFGRGSTLLPSGVEGPSGAAVQAGNQSAQPERIGGVRVDDQGFIRFPFVGRVRAAGLTASQLQSVIRDGLRGKSQDPQVMVSIDQSITNSVILTGEANRPGRFVLPTHHETLNQTIALSGGYKGEAKDIVARLQRRGRQFEIRLSDLLDHPDHDVPVAPGDTITLVSRPESFSSLGAPNRAEQIRFPRGRISVAEAVALAGGANPNAGDAAAIFVFRYVPRPGGGEDPVVYHLNMMQPGAYLLSQRFIMRDGDVLYVGNARANQLKESVQLLSQLFLPVVTVRNTVGNVIP